MKTSIIVFTRKRLFTPRQIVYALYQGKSVHSFHQGNIVYTLKIYIYSVKKLNLFYIILRLYFLYCIIFFLFKWLCWMVTMLQDVGLERITPKNIFQCMLERTDAITNEVLEPITFVLAYPIVSQYRIESKFLVRPFHSLSITMTELPREKYLLADHIPIMSLTPMT